MAWNSRQWRDGWRAVAVLVVGLALGACGGGGSSGGGASGSPAPTPGPTPPPVSTLEAARFLNQASFGATEGESQKLQALGDSSNAYARWIDAQLAQPASLQLPAVQLAYTQLANPIQMMGQLHGDRQETWLRHAVTGPDQLRQRVAFALSEIMVVSQQGALGVMPFATADYHDLLTRNALGDFRTLLQEVTLHPAMGVYLSMLGNQKPDPARNIRPDENYARELMQLFTIGLVELNRDGTPRLDGAGQPIPTYDQAVIEGFAHVFTGWNYAGAASFAQARRTLQNQVLPMQAYAEQHDTGPKRLLAYAGAAKPTLPAGQSQQQDLADALDNLFNHPNVPPFIGRQLIQRLVTSNPSPAYVERVARVFENDGSGRRGNLAAVVRAILLDAEARSASGASAGKLKEPLLRLTQFWRAYDAKAANGQYRSVNLSVSLGQAPLAAPSVFNFFSPGYAPSGEIANAGQVAPELQIATEYQNTQVTNLFYQQAFLRHSATPGLPENAVVIDITAELALAGDPEALVNRVVAKLLAGQVSATLTAEARAAVERVPASSAAQRVSEAIYLIVTSPEYALQR